MNKQRGGVIREYDISSPHIKALLAIIYLICIIMVIVSVFPPIWVFLSSFKDIREFVREPSIFPPTYDFQKFVVTWNTFKFGQFYLNSFYSVTGSVVCAIVFNGLLAYGLSVLKPRGHKIILALVMWSLLIPATTSIVPLFVNINRIGLNGFFTPLWLIAGANAFYVILFKQFFDAFPDALLEAAKIDGCTDMAVFTKILLPLSKPICVVIAIYAINAAWSDFLLPYLVLNNTSFETVMVKLFEFKDSNANDVEVLRAIVFSIIPPIILFSLFQKQITETMISSGIKG
ncbi:MAG: carbohydrate ABC transporter permease [Clostridiales bacterium]|jgi:multiple sugar transport system permease protein|nr:carbohydrate ABC transporter permease [Clostridiales bacterium]